jgi:hypothetical protein
MLKLVGFRRRAIREPERERCEPRVRGRLDPNVRHAPAQAREGPAEPLAPGSECTDRGRIVTETVHSPAEPQVTRCSSQPIGLFPSISATRLPPVEDGLDDVQARPVSEQTADIGVGSELLLREISDRLRFFPLDPAPPSVRA